LLRPEPKIVVTRALTASKRLKREVKVRLGDVGAAAAVERIVGDTAVQLSKEWSVSVVLAGLRKRRRAPSHFRGFP